ncbi:unnamed protein product, partial [Pylaiella littoralis]
RWNASRGSRRQVFSGVGAVRLKCSTGICGGLEGDGRYLSVLGRARPRVPLACDVAKFIVVLPPGSSRMRARAWYVQVHTLVSRLRSSWRWKGFYLRGGCSLWVAYRYNELRSGNER